MNSSYFHKLDLSQTPSPCYVIDEVKLRENLSILKDVADASGASVLAAIKAFSMWSLGDIYKEYLAGTCASGLYEARLSAEHYGGETHVYSAAYPEEDLSEMLGFADHIIFNSMSQWKRFLPLCHKAAQERSELRFGLRINPEHSEAPAALYDPCAPCSRLGIPFSQIDHDALEGISGLHFHTLCEQGFEPLERTIEEAPIKLPTSHSPCFTCPGASKTKLAKQDHTDS